jgi:hypothetical protein
MSELIWVTVPQRILPVAGGAAQEAVVRVLVVPRLQVPTDLAALGNWPQWLADHAQFLKLITNGSAQRRPVRYVSRARPEVWSEFFPANTNVRPPSVVSYDPPNTIPTFDDAARAAGSYQRTTRAGADNDDDTAAVIRDELVTRWQTPDPDTVAMAGTPLLDIHFHATVSMLREHPNVMLDLGLVFEVIVRVDHLAAGNPAEGRQLRIVYSEPSGWVNTAPWTRYELALDGLHPGFWPAPSATTSGIHRGVLDISDSSSIERAVHHGTSWAVGTFDVDGATGKLRQAARDLAADPQLEPIMPQKRSAGLVLMRKGRGAELAVRAGAARMARTLTSMADAVLGAEDLVLGYRLDISLDDSAWRSVCRRYARYTVNDRPIGQTGTDGYLLEEGHVKPFAAMRGPDDTLYADEVVLRWDGWSQAVPIPNLRGNTPGPVSAAAQPLPYRFEMSYRTPVAGGSDPDQGLMPRLRFARKYRMRVRIADLAGGGVEVADLESFGRALRASDEIQYTRHDPVQPPRLGGPDEFTPGGAIDRLVIRTDNGTAEDTFAAGFPATDVRTLDPPTASLQLIEQHGVLDRLSDHDSFDLALQAMCADGGPGLGDPVAQGVSATIVEIAGQPADINARDAWGDWHKLGSRRIELVPDTSGPVTMTWTGSGADRTLQIGLNIAKQAIIELSSSIRSTMSNQMAMALDLAVLPPKSNTDTLNGRNPVVSPPRRILVVHAVKKPLASPLWNEPLTVVRNERETTILLRPTFTNRTSGAGLNPDSTARLDVAATWTEYADTGPTAHAGNPVSVDHVASQTIPLGTYHDGDPVTVEPIRHEFGDTKHRRVTYTLKATTRFREYFDASDDEDQFQLSGRQRELNVLSTVRPPPPVVLSVLPAFDWRRMETDAQIEHLRSSRRLRVEVARPWYASGEGEKLAVLLGDNGIDPGAARDLMTRIGRDPLFAATPTEPRPAKTWFPGGTSAPEVFLPEAGGTVTVIPFDVIAADDRWYADIEFGGPTDTFYNPFVRLALARYQPDSLDSPVGMHLSPVVVTDTVPLLPDRRTVVRRNGNVLTVTVEGASPTPANHLTVTVEECPAEVDPAALDAVADDTVAADVPAWRPKGAPVNRNPDGTIPPITLPDTTGHLRLRLCESEDRLGAAVGEAHADVLRRNVFVDTLVLPAAWHHD